MRYSRLVTSLMGFGALTIVSACSIDMAGLASVDAGFASAGGAIGTGGGHIADTGGISGTGGMDVPGTGGDIVVPEGTGGSVVATGGTGTGGAVGTGGVDAGVPGTGGLGTGGAGGRVGSGGSAMGGRGGSSTGGAGGVPGTGGAATGGRVGAGGAATGGRVGTGGFFAATGGRVGTGGTAGTGAAGSGGAKPECTKASDCRLQSDCCNCRAVPVGTQDAQCQLACVQSKCAQLNLPDGAVDCVAGRCVAGFNCESTKVTCMTSPPACAAGEAPGVNAQGTCYTGVCVPVTQCKRVSSCAACSSSQACVSYAAQQQSGTTRIHCVTVPTTCSGAGSCDCMGPSSCVNSYTSCTPLSGVRGVSCSCPNC